MINTSLKNNVALITGAAGHLGSCIARTLANRDCNLVLLDKSLSNLQKLELSIKEGSDVQILLLEEDLGKKECFGKISAKISQNFKRVDYLVNNAAFYDEMPGWGVSFENETFEAWDAVMHVNLFAPFFLTQTLYPLLLNAKNPSIVNVSSIYSEVGPDWSLYDGTTMTNEASYSASKGGLVALTRWLSTQLAPRIRVNAVTPGGIYRNQNKEFVKRYEQKTPLNRMATESDIAKGILFALSDESSYITGHNFIIDGGFTTF